MSVARYLCECRELETEELAAAGSSRVFRFGMPCYRRGIIEGLQKERALRKENHKLSFSNRMFLTGSYVSWSH